MQVNNVLLWTTLGSALAVLPAAVRCGKAGSLALAWVGLWGASLVWTIPMALVLWSSRNRPRIACTGLAAILIGLPGTGFLGELLHHATRHRPLGAATLAVLGSASLLLCIAACVRILIASRPNRLAPFGWALPLVAMVALVGETALIARAAHRQGTAGLLSLLDVALLLLGSAVGARLGRVGSCRVRWGGLGVSALMVLTGMTVLIQTPWLRTEVWSQSPVLVALTSALVPGAERP